MAKDPEQLAHLEWLGYVQPVGLVVSIPALLAAAAHINRNIIPDHQRFLDCLPRDAHDELISELRDVAEFTQQVLGWRAGDLEPVPAGDARYASIEVPLPEYNETLRPTHVVRELEPKDPQHPWMMLIQLLPAGTALDDVPESTDRTWHAAPQARFERLLRETRVPIGLLCNATQIRIVYAPRGETSGYATFSVSEMAQVAGRPIFAALHMLLCEERLFSLGEKQRLPAILADSRKYQNVVSTQLAQQVLSALFELLRGFHSADDQRKGELLRQVLADDPNQVYSGLLTVLMRLVFILYAEDRGLLSSDPIYANYYSVTGLFERLRADAGRYTDTMDQRYGSWAQLLTLFRLIFEGGSHGDLNLPARKGYLFDPERYPFLEGRPWKSLRQPDETIDIPRVSDGVLFRVLNSLLILDGERLSYRTLDVEQIGSVYETIMGFELEVAKGRSIAIKPAKSHGAPATINLEELLAAKPAERTKWLAKRADQKISGQAAEALEKAATIEELLAGLEKKIADNVTPNAVPKGAMIFQPSDERRRSGSHYTPRSLTEPIVRKTLEPILKNLADSPTPQQILDLKVCDPAMGSAAFLVETCRQLGDVLVKAWHVHNQVPQIPLDEDEILHARRLIAQRCLYGVDKNAMAVDLAKLSLWLATLAKDHPFTFLDHALRHGDSLVGLTRTQIAEFHWLPTAQRSFGQDIIEQRIKAATGVRQEIIEAGDEVPFLLKQQKLALADESLNLVRFAGNLVIAAFFAGENDKQRKLKREVLLQQFSESLRTGIRPPEISTAEQNLRSGEKAIHPFHWEIEFPEVFGREKGGFDAMVGNPPFCAGRNISGNFGDSYLDWLISRINVSPGQTDLSAHFLIRVRSLCHKFGGFGLITTNSISQGDSARVGLGQAVEDGAIIYFAESTMEWPGAAAVHISRFCVSNGPYEGEIILDGCPVARITASFKPDDLTKDKHDLVANQGRASKGFDLGGNGFLFTAQEYAEFVRKNPGEVKIIRPHINGKELYERPDLAADRFAINFLDWPLEEAERYPAALARVRELVKPYRDTVKRKSTRQRWWIYNEDRPGMRLATKHLQRVLVKVLTSNTYAFAFLPPHYSFDQALIVFAMERFADFAVLQSRVHEVWAKWNPSTMKSDARYTIASCFTTFPLPTEFSATLEAVGKEYYEFRAALLVKNNEGLTKTYNRFHDPNETSAEIKKLRELHAAMDQAVLDAYGWTDLRPTCEFLLDYDEEEEDEEDTGKAKKKKKPWRCRWPNDLRDDVLARLLELNKLRAKQERLTGEAAGATQAGTKKITKSEPKRSKKSTDENATLFDSMDAGGEP